jgi:putative ABC transport system ATP-binding protein
MSAMLNVRKVSKSYGEGHARVDALVDVDLTVEPGELVAIMGPSGSGKSTLLTIAGTLEDATSGEVTIGGQAVSSMSRTERARLRRRSIGYVFQDFNLLSGLTAAENVALPLELDGTRGKAARATALAALEQLSLGEGVDRYPEELSGGERQRVAIARAVVGDRRLLLADEPTGALDSINGEGVIRLVRAACKRGVAGVIVTHDAQLASWADRVVFLRDGRMVDHPMGCSPGSARLEAIHADPRPAVHRRGGIRGADVGGVQHRAGGRSGRVRRRRPCHLLGAGRSAGAGRLAGVRA